MITPLVRIPLDTSGPHLSIFHLFLFLIFSPPYLLPPTTFFNLLQPSPGAREDPLPSAPVRRAVVVLVRAEAASPPSRAAGRRRTGGARARGQAEAAAALSRSRRPERGVAARARGGSLASLPPSRAARRRRPRGPIGSRARDFGAGHGGGG